MRSKFNQKFKKIPEEMKASMWYTVSNIVQKIAPWLVMVILTRYLSTAEYGVYAVFLSWYEIIEIIVTLRMYSGGYTSGLIQNYEDKSLYTSTLQTLSFILIGLWLLIYIFFKDLFNKITGLSFTLTIMMIVSYTATTSFRLWSSRQRVENKYKTIFIATFAFGFIGPVVGACSVFFNTKNTIIVVIAIRIVIQLIVSLPFIFSSYKGTKKRWSKSYAIQTIKYNIPLLPYYLSMVILNHADRLMIQKIDGYAKAAIYSVAYSAAMIIFIISGAINLSLQVWIFKKLKERQDIKQSSLITSSTIIVALFVLFEVLLTPEIIMILGGKQYLEAIWVMPPIVVSVLVMFIYQQYVNILFYFKNKISILFASVFAAMCNIGLNAWLIPIYGYSVAGYTTLASYSLVCILYLVLMMCICKKNDINYKNYFNIPAQTIILLITIVLTGVAMILYNHIILRYLFIVIIVVVVVCLRKKIVLLLKMR